MKITFVVILISAAALVGYYFGRRHKEGPSPSSGGALVSAIVREPVRADAHVILAPTASSPDSLRYDPASALEVEVDAMRRGDVSAVAHCIVLTPEAKAVIESALALVPPEVAREYPTPEMLAAFVFCGVQRIQDIRIESTTYEQPDRATQRIGYKFESETEWRAEQISFVRSRDGWRRVIDAGMARRVAAIIGIRKR